MILRRTGDVLNAPRALQAMLTLGITITSNSTNNIPDLRSRYRDTLGPTTDVQISLTPPKSTMPPATNPTNSSNQSQAGK